MFALFPWFKFCSSSHEIS